MDSDKAGNAEDLDNEKLQLICKAYNRRLLSIQRVVDGINSMDYSKLKILCKYNNKFSCKGIEELLSNKEIVDNINDFDDDVFEVILNEGGILEMLKDGKVCSDEFDSSDDEGNEEDHEYYDNIDDKEDEKNDLNNFAKEALGNKGNDTDNENRVDDDQFYVFHGNQFCIVDGSQLYINEEILKFIFEIGKFSNEDMTKLLENKKILERINSIDPKKFKIILNTDKFNDTSIIVELLKNPNTIENINLISEELLKYIVENDKFSSIKVLEDREFIKLINLIDPEKSKSVFRQFYGTSIVIELLENQEVVKRINSMNRKIFDLIFRYPDQGYIMNLLKDQSLFDQINSLDESKVSIMKSDYFFTDKEIAEILKTSLPQLHSIDGNRLKIICKGIKFNSTDVKEILKDQSLFVQVNSIDLEKLELISSSSKFDRSMVMDLLKSRNFIDSINTEKFRLLLDSARLNDKRIITLLKDQNAVEKINSVTTKELKAITDNVTGKVFVNIFKNFKPSVKSTLRLAILLRKAGKITDINIDYLNNKERIYEDIIKYVPQELSIYTQYPFPGIVLGGKDLPQEQDININSLVPFLTFERYIECKEPVSKLYNLSLEQVIENINPHKRARYF
ncbi:hypothetical protein [Wolbachia endosymbiont of Rhagoletis cingulata]|uniref:hypothetical protein n=2 Tax=unclassified Wolbachia TaxID=2640676 RepID=UPI003AF409D9